MFLSTALQDMARHYDQPVPIMPERDREVEYEDWTTEVLSPARAFYATTTTTVQ
jgi:hypothetical protein